MWGNWLSTGSRERALRHSGKALFATEVDAWRQARDAEHRLLPQIVRYAQSTWGDTIFRVASHLFLVGRHSPDSARSVSSVFRPWFAFSWVPDWRDGYQEGEGEIDMPEGWPTASLGVSWLASEAPTLSHFERTFIVTAAESPYSMLLVETVTSGWYVVVRDLLTGRRFRVVDPEISERARPDDILFSAILTLHGVSTFLGLAAYSLPSASRVEIRMFRQVHSDARRVYSDDPWLTRAELIDVGPDLCNEYREGFDGDGVLELDAGGDVREPILLRWTLAAPFGDAYERLRPLSVYDREKEAIDMGSWPEGEPSALITWYHRPPSPSEDDWKMIGFLYLDEGRLAADVPTRALADRLVGEVAARLGATATLIETRSNLPVRVHAAASQHSQNRMTRHAGRARTFLGRLAKRRSHRGQR